jgi:hypothetical protein
MKRLLKYIISIILICVPAYIVYTGLVDFVTPPATNHPADQKKIVPQTTPTPSPKIELLPIKIITASKEITINAEIADNEQKRQYGLMNRKAMAKDHGMLFIYDKERVMTFWMKNTLIPLDVIFINSDKKIVSTETMPPCKADPCTEYSSVKLAKYGLEVNAGFVKENGITVGNAAVFELTNTK